MFGSDVNVALSTNFSLGPDSLLRDEQMACAVECQGALLLGASPKSTWSACAGELGGAVGRPQAKDNGSIESTFDLKLRRQVADQAELLDGVHLK